MEGERGGGSEERETKRCFAAIKRKKGKIKREKEKGGRKINGGRERGGERERDV